jgi:glutamate-1-semialdehyde 2,1-aminomutase
VSSYDDALRADTGRFARFFQAMLDEGVYIPPSQFEAMFVSLVHDERDVEALGRAARAALSRS